MKTAILVDSSSLIQTASQGIYHIPLRVLYGDTSFLDSVTIEPKDVIARLQKNQYLITEPPTSQAIDAIIKQIQSDGYSSILAFPISTGISQTAQRIEKSAQNQCMPCTIYDTYAPMNLIQEAASFARKCLDEGCSIEETLLRLDPYIKSSNTYLVPMDLKYLSRGNRLSPMAAQLANFLNINPIFTLGPDTQGKIEPLGKVRTMAKAVQYIINKLHQDGIGANDTLVIATAADKDLSAYATSLLEAHFPQTPLIKSTLPAVLITHIGLGAFGLQVFKTFKQ